MTEHTSSATRLEVNTDGHSRIGFVEIGVAVGEDTLVREFMEQQLCQLWFAVVNEGVQQRVFEPAQRGVRLNAVDIDVESLLRQATAVFPSALLGKVAAIGKTADKWIPPHFRLE